MADSTGPVTEIAFCPLKEGVDISNPANPAYQTWKDVINTISQQEGFIRTYWGVEMENPLMLDFYIGMFDLSF